MCDKTVPQMVNRQLHKTMVRPVMACGMENVSVTKRQEKKMQVAEMKMLRWSVGLTLKDRMRIEQIRARLAELTRIVREIRLWWLGHLVRREESYVKKEWK